MPPIAKVNDDLSVGSDLAFQRKWWRFERAVWVVFTGIVLLDLAGVFGHGLAAKAKAATADGAITVDYERIARFSAPTIATVHFGQSAIRDGRVRLWASDSVLGSLGLQLMNPQPADTRLEDHGMLFSYETAPVTDSVELRLQPRSVGMQTVTLRVPQVAELTLRIFVLP